MLPYIDGVTDRWAEVREIEGRVAPKIVERDKALWPPRRRRLSRDLRYLLILLKAAIADAEAKPPRYEGGMNPYMRRHFPASVSPPPST